MVNANDIFKKLSNIVLHLQVYHTATIYRPEIVCGKASFRTLHHSD